MSMLRRAAIAVVLALWSGDFGSAQTPQPVSPAPAAATPAVAQPEASPSVPYSYTREGRRDPFVSLVGRAGDGQSTGNRPPGVPGILINEMNIKGIVKQSSGFAALVQGPDKRTYVVRPGQRLLDGSIKSITADAVVFSQDVNDPLSTIKQREVRKTLRASEEGQG